MIAEAFLVALQVHEGQKRKDGLPYIAHPVEVATELARSGAEEALICAGFLHDTVEDAAITPEQLEKRFGTEVAALVSSDSEDKTKSWEQRKQAMLDRIRTGTRQEQMLLCADKLSNLRSIHRNLQEKGSLVWQQFKRGREQQAWLYQEIAKALAPLAGLPMYEEFCRLTEEIFL